MRFLLLCNVPTCVCMSANPLSPVYLTVAGSVFALCYNVAENFYVLALLNRFSCHANSELSDGTDHELRSSAYK